MTESKSKYAVSPELFFNSEEAVRTDIRLQSWEITGVGDEFRDSQLDFFGDVIESEGEWTLRYGGPDERIELANPSLIKQKPSIFHVKDQIDSAELWHLINDADWSMIPYRKEVNPPALLHGDHIRRTMWLRMFNIPCIVENHIMSGKMIFAEIPERDIEFAGLSDLVLDSSEYPVLENLLRAFVYDLSNNVKEHYSHVRWLYNQLNEMDRQHLETEITKAENDIRFVSFRGITSLDSKIGEKIDSIALIGNILTGLGRSFKHERADADQLLEISKLVQEFSEELRSSKRIVTPLSSVQTSRKPYESEAVLKIFYMDPNELHNPAITEYLGRKPQKISNTEHIRIPLYKNGRLLTRYELRRSLISELNIRSQMTFLEKLLHAIAPPRHVGSPNRLEILLFGVLPVIVVVILLITHGCQ